MRVWLRLQTDAAPVRAALLALRNTQAKWTEKRWNQAVGRWKKGPGSSAYSTRVLLSLILPCILMFWNNGCTGNFLRTQVAATTCDSKDARQRPRKTLQFPSTPCRKRACDNSCCSCCSLLPGCCPAADCNLSHGHCARFSRVWRPENLDQCPNPNPHRDLPEPDLLDADNVHRHLCFAGIRAPFVRYLILRPGMFRTVSCAA